MSEDVVITREQLRQMSPMEVVKAHVAAEDVGDPHAVTNTFTDDEPYYRVDSMGVRLSGKTEIFEFYSAKMNSMPDFVNLEPEWIEAPGHILLKVAFEATFSEPWGPFAPTGNKMHVETLADFIIAPDGLLKAEVVYMNTVDMFHQMGLLPYGNIEDLARTFQKTGA
jgi:hypothetical protein